MFADASSYAKGSVCYLRSEGVDGTFECRIVSARSRLSGSGVNTIPRLELKAALDAVKLAEFVKRELSFKSAHACIGAFLPLCCSVFELSVRSSQYFLATDFHK